jgi:hypothetical protein
MSAVWEADLPTTEKMVLLAIADAADDDGANAWPSVATLARKASVTPRRVQQVITALVHRGLLTVDPQAGGVRHMRHDRRPNLYAISLDGVQSISPRRVDGVKSEAPRGEIFDTDGVKPISPYPSLEPSLEPSKNTPVVAGPVAVAGSVEFAEFWAAYPRREARKAAEAAWRKARATVGADVIIAGARRYAADPNRDAAFTAHASTWLNQGRWDDEPLPDRSGKASGTKTYLEAANALQAFAPLSLGTASESG